MKESFSRGDEEDEEESEHVEVVSLARLSQWFMRRLKNVNGRHSGQ